MKNIVSALLKLNSAEAILKLKDTYGFRMVSVLKFQVSGSFHKMRNPWVSQIPDGFRTTETC